MGSEDYTTTDEKLAQAEREARNERARHAHTDDCTPQNCDISTTEWLERHTGRGLGWMTTFTGKQFSFNDPQPDQICIEDISHQLSMICHWNGACREFFSVAQHSAMLSRIVPWELQKWALLHDAAEAYCGDMIRPLKLLLPEYKIIEKRIMQAIANVFELSWPEPAELKSWDDKILKLESQMYMPTATTLLYDRNGAPTDIPNLTEEEHDKLPPFIRIAMIPRDAEVLFTWRYRKIFLDEDGL